MFKFLKIEKYHSWLLSSWIEKEADSEEQNRFFHYSIFSLLGIPTMVLFGSAHLINNHYGISLLIFMTGLSLGLGWRYLWKTGQGLSVYRFNILIFGLMLVYTTALAGKGEAILWCYIFPLVTLLLMECYEGTLWNLGLLISLLAIFSSDSALSHNYFYFTDFKIRFVLTYLMICTIAFWFEYLRTKYRLGMEENEQLLKKKQSNLENTIQHLIQTKQEKEAAIADLKKALHEVDTLREILPICSYCHKIREDDGYWSQLECYLGQHADISFSHGICPDCVDKNFAGISKRISQSGETRSY